MPQVLVSRACNRQSRQYCRLNSIQATLCRSGSNSAHLHMAAVPLCAVHEPQACKSQHSNSHMCISTASWISRTHNPHQHHSYNVLSFCRCAVTPTLHNTRCPLQTITGHIQAPFDHITMGLPDHNVHSYVVVVDEEASPTDETHRAPPKARLAAIGEPAELWLSGPRLARGYRNRPDLTAKAFVPNPFFAAATATLPADGGDLLRPHYRLAYRTGDLVAMSKDGTIDFLGRVDRQVKVNGVRMEVGEIENVLAAAPGEGGGHARWGAGITMHCRVPGVAVTVGLPASCRVGDECVVDPCQLF